MPICESCRDAADSGDVKLHTKCKGKTSCFCQHRLSGPTKDPVEQAKEARRAALQAGSVVHFAPHQMNIRDRKTF